MTPTSARDVRGEVGVFHFFPSRRRVQKFYTKRKFHYGTSADPGCGQHVGGVTMKLVPGKKLIVHTSEGRRFGKKSAYAAVLEELDRAGLRAAAAVRAMAGFGADGKISTTMQEVLSYDLPVVIEATDTAERIEAVLPTVLAIVADGLVEVREVEIAVDDGLPVSD